MKSILITGANIVNEGRISQCDVLVQEGRIAKIGSGISLQEAEVHINGSGKYLFPGVIDDQVHFREPGFILKQRQAWQAERPLTWKCQILFLKL